MAFWITGASGGTSCAYAEAAPKMERREARETERGFQRICRKLAEGLRRHKGSAGTVGALVCGPPTLENSHE